MTENTDRWAKRVKQHTGVAVQVQGFHHSDGVTSLIFAYAEVLASCLYAGLDVEKGRIMRRRNKVVSLMVLPVLVAGCLTSSALADEGRPRANDKASVIDEYLASFSPEELRSRELLADFQNWIVTQPEYPGGIVTTKNDPITLTKTFLWHGFESSKFMTRVADEAASRGIKTAFVDTRYDFPTFDVAARKIMDAAPRSGFEDAMHINGIGGVDFDFDGLTVEASFASELDKKEVSAAFSRYAIALSGVDIRVIESGPAYPSVTRQTDLPGYNAGGLIRNENNGICSSGFAVNLAGYGRRTTTARHCPGTWKAFNRPDSVYGSTIRTVSQAQARILSYTGSQYMFDGAYNDPNGYKKTVQGFQDLSLNDGVCASGGNSGVHCYLQVMNMNYLWNDGYGAEWQIRARHANGFGWKAQAQGDSGGPILVPYSNGKVGAAGMIQGGVENYESGTGCANTGGQAVYGNTLCFSDVFFTSTRTMVNNMPSGSSLVTG